MKMPSLTQHCARCGKPLFIDMHASAEGRNIVAVRYLLPDDWTWEWSGEGFMWFCPECQVDDYETPCIAKKEWEVTSG